MVNLKSSDEAIVTSPRPNPISAPTFKIKPSGSDLGRLDVQDFAGASDGDRPRLHGLRDLAHEVDVQEPVRQARAPDLHIVGEVEDTPERPPRHAPVEH